jgi:alkyldihydroxyacetonephosphate synthase
MSGKEDFFPDWTSTAPREGTYRSIFKWGAPDAFKHPNRRLYAMLKDKLQMSDDDFREKKSEGAEAVSCDIPRGLSKSQIDAIKNIVGPENVAEDDYSRVKHSSGKTMEEAMDLRKGIVGDVADLVAHPRNKEDVAKIVEYCNEQRIAIYPYGGGSSVTLGLKCVRDSMRREDTPADISLNRLNIPAWADGFPPWAPGSSRPTTATPMISYSARNT